MRQDTLTYEQASRYCGKPVDTLRKLVSRGFLHAEKQQGHREKLLSRQDVERFFNMPTGNDQTQQNPPVNDPESVDGGEITSQALLTRMDNLVTSIERLAASIENALIEEAEPGEEQEPVNPAKSPTNKAPAQLPTSKAPAQLQPAKKPTQAGTQPSVQVNTPDETQYRFVRRNGRKVKRTINQ